MHIATAMLLLPLTLLSNQRRMLEAYARACTV
jgi:hypothetical protein